MDTFTNNKKVLSETELSLLEAQNSRCVTTFQAESLEKNARKHWDLFYKRNETKFFKDRHWTTREFEELLNENCDNIKRRTIFEIGCGVGNLIFPLIADGLNLFVIACDLSPRAVEMVKSNKLYNNECMKVLVADITTEEIFQNVQNGSIDIVTLVFVLSAIHPEKFTITLKNIFNLLKPGGVLLFRDYGLYDMAQLRFKAGHKISENFYMRQDGTRSYYFSTELLEKIITESGFQVISNSYVHRRTINKKENIDVPRIFIQGKFKKPD